MDSAPEATHIGRMWKLVVLVLAGCDLYAGSESAPPDAAAVVPVTCTSTVQEICGPRPPRAATEMWAHDIDLWAKCAERAEPTAR